jgi:hypothetical protein
MAQSKVVVLCRVRDRNEADIVASLLASKGIPCSIRTAGYFTGLSVYGTDGWTGPDDRIVLLVPADALAPAQRLLSEAREAGRLAQGE